MAVTNPSLTIKLANAVGGLVKGIFAPDVVIKNLLDTGIRDLRANQWELQLVFSYMLEDATTGQKEIKRATDWFLNSEIPVLWNLQLRPDTMPSISYALQGGEQNEETLADIHYDTQEAKVADWEPISQTFSPTYTPTTGLVKIPSSVMDIVPVNDTMVMVTGAGVTYPMTNLSLPDGFIIDKNLVVDLKNSVIKNSYPRLLSNIESKSFKEIIRVGIHAIGDPVQAIWLFSICKYILLKYNRVLLEARGLECTSMSYGPYDKDPSFPAEQVYSRLFTIVGKARDNWSSLQSERIAQVEVSPKYAPAPATFDYSPTDTATGASSQFGPEPGQEDPAWEALLNSDIVGTAQ